MSRTPIHSIIVCQLLACYAATTISKAAVLSPIKVVPHLENEHSDSTALLGSNFTKLNATSASSSPLALAKTTGGLRKGKKAAIQCYQADELNPGALEDCQEGEDACFAKYEVGHDNVITMNRYCTKYTRCIPHGPMTWQHISSPGQSYFAKCCQESGCNGGIVATLEAGLTWIHPADDDKKFLTRLKGGGLAFKEFDNTMWPFEQKWRLAPIGEAIDSKFSLVAPDSTTTTAANEWEILQVANEKYTILSKSAGSLSSIVGNTDSLFAFERTTAWDLVWREKRCPQRIPWVQATDPETCQAVCDQNPACKEIIEWDPETKECFLVTGACHEADTTKAGAKHLTFKSKCAGITCAAYSQCHDVGTCDSHTGVCTNPLSLAGTVCDDKNWLTVRDSCQAGQCAGTDLCANVACPAPSQCFDSGHCDHLDGKCVEKMKGAGAACNDLNPNTVNDICNNGVCAGVDLCADVTCAAGVGCHATGVCNHATGICSAPLKPDAAFCDDGESMTINDQCTNGVCMGVGRCVGVTCTAKDQCHTAGSCNPKNGQCDDPFLPSGSACNDQDGNTVKDQCNGAGTCAGTNLCADVVCEALSNCHLAGVCDFATGVCSNPLKQANAPCDDANALTIQDVCDADGSCAGRGRCEGVSCEASSDCHALGTCDPATGQCSNPFKPSGAACDDKNADTVSDQCSGGGTCAGKDLCAGVVCAALDSCHEPGQCSPQTGECDHPLKVVGGTCDDFVALTINDVCDAAGVCAGKGRCEGVTCAAESQCHATGTCDPQTGTCSNPFLLTGAACDDENADTVNDECDGAGSCSGTDLCFGVVCAARDGCHVEGACDRKTGTCSHPTAPDGRNCDDSNDMTIGDVCKAGVCAGHGRCEGVTCEAASQCHAVGACSPKTGECSNPFLLLGAACNDDNANTVNDECNGNGACAGQDLCAGVTCEALDDCHDVGVCSHATGTCSNPNKSDGATCDDKDSMTVDDKCSAGVCEGKGKCEDITCKAASQCHAAGTCDAATGKCSNPFKASGESCNDGSQVTMNDKCDGSGACAGEDLCKDVTCTAKSDCHQVGVCDHKTGTCSEPAKPDGAACDDKDDMTISDQCTAGACAGHGRCEGVVCASPVSGSCMAQGECDPKTGACSSPLAPVESACDDGSSFTMNDKCPADGQCLGENLCEGVTCSAKDQCHEAGVCDQQTGTCSDPVKPTGATCDDKDSKTINDICTSGTCAGHSRCKDVVCHAKDQCHATGTCDEATGKCSDPFLAEGATCNDNKPSTVNDKCDGAGACIGENLCKDVKCEAKSQCHEVGVCDPQTGTCSDPEAPDSTSCDDKQSLTINDMCKSGVCAGHSRCQGVVCTAQSQCHTPGQCNPDTGKCDHPFAPKDSACNDLNTLTVEDKCDGDGGCAGKDLCDGVVCAAKSDCHNAGICSPQTGKCSEPEKPDGAQCDDKNDDTVLDQCKSGSCAGVGRCEGVTCNAASQCHAVGKCDPKTGTCSNPFATAGKACDDGSAITSDDKCDSSGTCAGVDLCLGVSCNAADDCHDPGTCNPATGECLVVSKPNGNTCAHDDPSKEGAPGECQAGGCVAKDLCLGVQCVALSQCHEIGTCHHANGQCSNPLKEEGASCDDQNDFTGPDTCTAAGICFGKGTTTTTMANPPTTTTALPTTTTTTTSSTSMQVQTTSAQDSELLSFTRRVRR